MELGTITQNLTGFIPCFALNQMAPQLLAHGDDESKAYVKNDETVAEFKIRITFAGTSTAHKILHW
jgi:hypothetical protein